jgi:hypothetical protein
VDGLFVLNRVVDSIFIIDLVLQFFIMWLTLSPNPNPRTAAPSEKESRYDSLTCACACAQVPRGQRRPNGLGRALGD